MIISRPSMPICDVVGACMESTFADTGSTEKKPVVGNSSVYFPHTHTDPCI